MHLTLWLAIVVRVERFRTCIAKIASAQWPDEVVVRLSDFKTNEYADLIGGAQFEPHEENPMLGFRGASRYYSLKQGENDLLVYVMAEIPTNILEAEDFAERFDGFSIGSNDLTQLVLGIGRDAERLSGLFDESEASVKKLIKMLIEGAHAANRKVGICGEAPSNDPAFAAFLVQCGIDSISLAPDSVIQVIERVAEVERDG